MKDLKQQCTILIKNYLRDRHFLKFIADLKTVEAKFKGVENNDDVYKSLWFRFSDDDTMATTINNIVADLTLPPFSRNYKFLIERFEYAVENDSLKAFIS